MQQLIESAKRGDKVALVRLFQILQTDKRVIRTVRSLSYDKSVLDKEDAKAEFWRGVLQGVAVVRHDMGDPVLHLVQRGIWQVKSIVKHELNKNIVQYCERCRRINSQYSFIRVCEKCTSSVENISRAEDCDVDVPAMQYIDRIASVTNVEVKGILSPNQLHILELLIQACLDDSDHPQADIARALGISRERVRQQMEKIRPMLVID